jgi:tetratricopeptide (TPR) repeat protein
VSLAPMIGIIQVGNQARADRYLYLAMLGPLVALVGGVTPVATRSKARPGVGPAALPWTGLTVAVALVCLPLTWRQAGVWRDSIALFSRALAAGHDSAVARNNLGLALTEADRPADALPHLLRAVELRPDDADAWFNLGNTDAALGDLPAARGALERCLALDPRRSKAWNNLGIVLVLGGDEAAAEAAWRRSLAIRPDFPDARLNLTRLQRSRGEAAPAGDGPERADSGDGRAP